MSVSSGSQTIAGQINLFNVLGVPSLKHTITGNAQSGSIGSKLEVRTNALPYGINTIEVFYNNFLVGANYVQTKIGRLSVLVADDGEVVFDNEFNYFIPKDGWGGQMGDFAVCDQRIAVKIPDNEFITYGHMCSFDEFYMDLAGSST